MFREPEEEKEETASVETLSDRLRTVKSESGSLRDALCMWNE
jgi:hypothetical protein